jgi:hypothetical protein
VIDPVDAAAFAEEWIAAWNSRDLDHILSHYAPDVRFLSPGAARLTGEGEVRGMAALRAYWAAALAQLPDLHFTLDAVLTGHNGLTILYRNERGQRVAETLELGADGRVTAGAACYAVPA